MRVLRAQDSGQRPLELLVPGLPVERGLLPEEVAELLRRVGVPERPVKELVEHLGATAFLLASKRLAMNGRKSPGSITSSWTFFALRQNGSFSSLKIRSIMCRRLPR